MFQQTPQKRVLFPRGLNQIRSGGFVVFGLLLIFVAALLASLFAPANPALAATNNTLSFQARLMTASGAIVPDGTYNVQFKLYTGGTAGGPAGVGQANAGTNLWTETWYDSNGATTGSDARVTVRNGYLSVNLGSQTAFPTTISWDQELWISLNVGGTAQTASPTWDGEMNPRLKLTGTPYAFRAGQLATAHTSNGFTSTLNILQPTGGDQSFQIADQGAPGTYTLCVQNSTACGFALASGNNNYIQNQNVSQQATSNFWISGTGRADTALQAPALDTAAAGTLTIGSANATAINFNTGGTLEWSILSTGEFQGNGASVVRSSTGNITIASNGGNGNVILTPNGTGYTSISAGGLRMDTTEVITSGRVLQNVTANTSILTAGTLGVGRGGTGVATTPTNGQVLIGNGTGYTLGTLGSSGGITVTNTAGGISIGTDATICKTTGNCAGAGNGITGSGTTNTIAMFTANGTVGDSILSQNGTTIDVSGNIQGTTANFNSFQTNGTTRLDASGNLSNIGTIGASGNITTSATVQGANLNATTALQTNGVTRIDASGNLTNIANITLSGGVNARGYGTSNTSNTNVGQWTKLATCSLTLQYQDCRSQATIVSTSDGGSIDRATVDIRVKQQNVMGGVPYIAVHLYNTQDIATANISAVTTVNTSGSTVVELWGRIDDSFQVWSINPLINTGSVQFAWLSTQGFSVSLPAGTVTASVYGPQTVSTLTASGDISTSADINVGGQTVITSGRVLQNVTASAGILTSGTIASGLLTGSYTGITAVGTLTSLTVSGAITSTVTTGTAPLVVASTTKVANLNADLLDGLDSSAFALASGAGNYIQNQNSAQQTSSNFWISGTGRVDGSITTPTLQNAGTLNISATGANQINFNTNGVLEWSVLSTGELQGNGASVVRSSTGNITIASNGGNGNVVLTPNGTGYTSVSAGGLRMGTTEVISSGRALQNVTGYTQSSGSATFNQNAADQFRVIALQAPNSDMVNISNAGFPATVAGTNGMQIDYFGGAAAVEGAAARFNITPGTTSGGTWSALRVVAGAATTGVASNGIKLESTTGTGTQNALYVTSGWDNIINLNGTSIMNGSGILQSAGLSGSYTGITGVGTITTGTWQGTAIADAYVADNLTVSTAGNVAWTALNAYPTGCSAGQAVTAVGDTLTCSTFATTDTNTTYSAGNDLDISGTTFNIEPQLDSVTTISRASSNLTLQTTTSGNIILNSAGTVNITGDTNVTGGVTISGELQTGSMRTLKATYGAGESNQWKRIATVPATDGMVQVEGTIGGQDFFTAGQGHAWVDLGFSYRNGYLVHGTSKGHMASDSGARANIIMMTNGTTLEIYIEKTAYTQYALNLRASGSATLLDDAWTSTDPRGRAGWTTQQELTDQLLLAGNNSITYNGAALPALTLYGGNVGVGNDLNFSGTTVITAARVLQNVTANASILTSGTIASGLLSGSYTGITGVGALSAGSIGSGFGTISTGSNITTTAAVQGGTVTGTTSVTTPTLQNAGTLNISATGANQINFNTNGSLEWSVLSTGELQGNGASVVRSSTGNITIASNGGNGNVLLTPNGTGYTSVSAGGFRMATTEVISSGRVLQNVTASASILTSGTVASGLLTGGYTGITAVGTLTSLTASGVITSTVTTGTAPLVVASTTKVANLNVDLLDGLDSTAFAASSGSANYIQNQNLGQQSASFNINGSGYIGNTGVYAFSVANGSNAGFMNVNTTGSGILQVTPYSSGGGVQILGGTAQSPEYSLFASTNGTTANNVSSRWTMLGNWVFFGGMGTTNRMFFDVGGTNQASLDNAGNFKYRTSSSQGTPDVAEYIPAAPDVAVADVVMADPDNTERVVKASGAYSGAALGVISDGTSGIQINPYENLDGTKTRTDVMPLVLAGRVPVKVTNEGGVIRPGDSLTVSSTTGHAMKATRAGATIGKSLGFFDGTTGTVLALINASYYDPNDGDNIQAQSGAFDTLQASAADFGSLNVSGPTTLSSLTVTGNTTLQGDLVVQGKTIVNDIQVDGRIVVNGSKPIIEVGEALGNPTVANGAPVADTMPTADVDGNDTAGTITVKAGATGTKAGILASIKFAKQYDSNYKVVISASNNLAGRLNVYVVKSADGFVVMTEDTVDTSQEYHFDYITIGAKTASAN